MHINIDPVHLAALTQHILPSEVSQAIEECAQADTGHLLSYHYEEEEEKEEEELVKD